MKKDNKIEIENYFVNKLSLRYFEENEKNENEGKISLRAWVDDKNLSIKLDVEVFDEARIIELSIIGQFSLPKGTKNKEKILSEKGTPILYEYAKITISGISLFDKFPLSVTLPSIDFEKQYEKKKENEKGNTEDIKTKEPKAQEPR